MVEGGRGKRGMRELLFLRWVIESAMPLVAVVIGRESGKNRTIVPVKIDLCNRLS